MTGHADRATVTWTDENDVFGITLCAPPSNALVGSVITGLADALGAFGRSHARALMLSSAVPGWFASSGPAECSDTADRSTIEQRTRLHACLHHLASADRPSIAVIEGQAVGAGLELAMACTLTIGSPGALLTIPDQICGPIEGERAAEIGLLDELVDDGNAGKFALLLARSLATRLGPALTQLLRGADDPLDVRPDAGMLDRPTGVMLDGPGARPRLRAYLDDKRALLT